MNKKLKENSSLQHKRSGTALHGGLRGLKQNTKHKINGEERVQKVVVTLSLKCR